MKKQLLLALAALGLIACNGEDVAQVETNSSPLVELDTITFIGGSQYDIMVFEDNKIQQHRIGNNYDGTYDLNYNYAYNQEGDLETLTGVDSDGEIFFERTVSYDSQGRIIGKNDTSYNLLQGTTSSENVVFTYDDVQNTVFADYNPDDDTVNDRAYHFNAGGLVYKVTNGAQTIQEIGYAGNNIGTLNGVSVLYDTATDVKGEFLNIYRNHFNSYKNFVLYNGYLVAGAVANNYIVKLDEDPGVLQDVNYTYEFDADGYPIKMTTTTMAGYFQEAIITYK